MRQLRLIATDTASVAVGRMLLHGVYCGLLLCRCSTAPYMHGTQLPFSAVGIACIPLRHAIQHRPLIPLLLSYAFPSFSVAGRHLPSMPRHLEVLGATVGTLSAGHAVILR